MMKIGCHLSSSKGLLNMGETALSIGGNTFQFFTRNPRGSKAKELDPKDAEALVAFAAKHNFATILAHAPYTLNPCSNNVKTREFAKIIMEDDLNRMEYLPDSFYNFHPGSHVGQGTEEGISLIVDFLNDSLRPDQTTRVLLETMSGKGTEIGGNFQELKLIIDGVKLSDKLGICMDTCHVFDGGYDIRSNLNQVLDEFNRTIGLDKLYAVHLNDTMNGLGSHKDRHAKIGEGSLGLSCIKEFINHPSLKDLPFYLETPNELEGYGEEIKLLRSVYEID